MAKVLTTTGIVAVIQDLIKKSTKELVLVSPFVQIPENYIQNLISAANRGVLITLVFGKDKLGENERKKLATVKKIETQDLIDLKSNGQFQILGRMNQADLRGCSLMYN
jgi:sugar-specific transcriptional regulator TrmB